MKIMSINCGSSSLKFKLFEMPEEKIITEGQFERIATVVRGVYTIKINGKKETVGVDLNDHATAVKILLNDLIERKIISSYDEIKGVGHRVVQGGCYFNKSVLIDEDVKMKIKELIDLAPLHNYPNLVGIEAFEKVIKDVKQVAVFDTAFHQTMDEDAFMYAIPIEWYKNYQIRKYGAHGTSHKYVANEYAKFVNKDIKTLKIVTCHIGNGVSICAVKYGESKDTSMGFTPLEGVPMGTRSGSVDPSIVSYISKKENKTASEVVNELNKNSGYLGMIKTSSDVREVTKGYLEGDENCILTSHIQEKRMADYIASYANYMEGIDAIVFTAGIGEHVYQVRERVVERLKFLGCVLDKEQNENGNGLFRISANNSKVDIVVIPTNEELVIARDAIELIK